ncbi:MAG: glycosyltransferase family 2 protein [Candidatus Levybacteria bacterium]|nr:glycosyltransferase family 2 protein [Candidatus Levybacteria bacterium]
MLISAIILTKNEEKNIVDCIESLNWCDEIIVIDDNSEDRTCELTLQQNSGQAGRVKIFTRSLNKNFSDQRNFGLSKTKNDWVLFIDADERVPDDLKNEIEYLTLNTDRSKQLNGYFIKRRDFMWEKELKYGETGSIKLLRLARKDSGSWKGMVHEGLEVKGKTGELNNYLLHYPHQTIAEFLKEINYYTDIRAKELFEKRVKVNWLYILFYSTGKFISNYLIKKGFKDGIEGFIFAIMMSLHSFLVRGKLWLLWQKK